MGWLKRRHSTPHPVRPPPSALHGLERCLQRTPAPADALTEAAPLSVRIGMRSPSDVCPGFIVQPERCWRMVCSAQMQATHCRGATTFTGRWRSPKGDQWWRVWACEHHLEGLIGIRQFGSAPRR